MRTVTIKGFIHKTTDRELCIEALKMDARRYQAVKSVDRAKFLKSYAHLSQAEREEIIAGWNRNYDAAIDLVVEEIAAVPA